ncbi:hypothetical protein L916_02633 [Phytophthora nicotianae]|uniref:Uncharacterized protein n=1 Tax=Phytophthora nicotianae TaxID=4792 RepID=W2JMI7_PHYNI|nr:hypothetical protein L916_02633 [Phytophthora nicotianae]
MYITGTIQTDRAGYAKGVVTAKKYKTVNKRRIMQPPQGTIKLAQNKRFPQLTAAMGMDRNPVHLLSSGGSRRLATVMRRIEGEMKPLPAPDLIRDYHRWMGGVDVHDRLRMQRYSVQLSYKSRKYYRTLFLGLFDMALVNAFIVYRFHRKVNGKRPPKHFAFFKELMEQLLAIDSAETFRTIEEATNARERTASSPAREGATSRAESDPVVDGDHRLEENPDTVDGEKGVKRRQRSCKVCALYKVHPRKFTKYYCPECSNGNRRKYLCNVGRDGRDTCFRIWHIEWKNGNEIPHLPLAHKTRERPPASRPGKKRRRNLQGEDDGSANKDGGNANHSEGDDDREAGTAVYR